ncbi:T9SS type A sorting domain-containing protein, partial [Candidatus Saccharibacteria bacterium]|nr:T9SS type A sorting domain-containing protein [Candidatus Saccharibacteria bacterium]NIV72306.1 T9SS type A sorting domain-containing protein [Calditrichia bacterium]NIV98772.1 T9SS type A sorting domain-containing protein [Candidatus Saccharibacteria bacterium]NIW79596.1 T9SS type A sorting domain-containing protein [Calditrichia bacterium]
IRYDLPQSGQLKITIFDVLGRKVTTLVDGFKSASSEQKVLWTPRNRASGVYFVVMDALGEQHVRKILLVK